MEKLKSQFDQLINTQTDELLGFVGERHENAKFVLDVCSFSVDKLNSRLTSSSKELSTMHSIADGEVLLSDQNLVTSSLDSIQSVMKRDVGVLRESLTSTLNMSVKPLSNSTEEMRNLVYLLSQYNTLMDLLEIPQLMETCLRNKLYAEALNLHDFVVNRSECGSSIYAMLSVQVRKVRSDIEKFVEKSLCEEQCVDEVQSLLVLYRLLHPEEGHLGLRFLEFRKTYFRNTQKSGDVTLGLYLPPMVAMCKLLFPEILPDLNQFVREELANFLSRLREDNQSLSRQLFDSCMQMCSMMEELGFGITPIVVDIFTQRLESQIAKKINAIASSFKQELDKYDWVPFLSLSNGEQSLIELTRHRPLAIMFNNFVEFFIFIRSFPLKSLQQPVKQQIDQLLRDCVSHIRNKIPKLQQEKPKVNLMVGNLETILVPAVEGFYDQIFPRQQIVVG